MDMKAHTAKGVNDFFPLESADLADLEIFTVHYHELVKIR